MASTYTWQYAVIIAAHRNDENDDDNESGAEEVLLRPAAAEALVALSVLDGFYSLNCSLHVPFGAFEGISSIGTFHSVKGALFTLTHLPI